ncbi:MAG: hypothetical protein RQ966_12700, partial [Acetobacteraceae bacterium]|nr:hypothetical protein [Acetobacteraceae bacterium]
MPTVKYRFNDPNMIARRTKLAVPGWAGAQEPRADRSHEQPWHCIPFSEASASGIEIPYPYDEELHVTFGDGLFRFKDAEGESIEDGPGAPPFRSFGAEYYTLQTSMDLKVDETFAIKVETHPRFYTDRTGTVPVAVPAIIRRWWPMIYFVVFKAPMPGQTDIFRPGEPFVQLSIIEADSAITLEEMPAEEAAEREVQSERIYQSRQTLASGTRWTSSTNT